MRQTAIREFDDDDEFVGDTIDEENPEEGKTSQIYCCHIVDNLDKNLEICSKLISHITLWMRSHGFERIIARVKEENHLFQWLKQLRINLNENKSPPQFEWSKYHIIRT